MKTFYLVVARQDAHSDKNLLSSLLKALSAQQEYDCLWKFTTDGRPYPVLSQIYERINAEFSFCLIWRESFDAPALPWHYQNDAYLGYRIAGLMDENKLSFDSLLQLAVNVLSAQEAHLSP
jgi:hypothetical protein